RPVLDREIADDREGKRAVERPQRPVGAGDELQVFLVTAVVQRVVAAQRLQPGEHRQWGAPAQRRTGVQPRRVTVQHTPPRPQPPVRIAAATASFTSQRRHGPRASAERPVPWNRAWVVWPASKATGSAAISSIRAGWRKKRKPGR